MGGKDGARLAVGWGWIKPSGQHLNGSAMMFESGRGEWIASPYLPFDLAPRSLPGDMEFLFL